MNFSTEKKYITHDGMKARFVTSTLVDGEVVNIFVLKWPAGGEFITSVDQNGWHGGLRIQEVSPWADFKIDDKVEVRVSGNLWVRGYYAGVSGDGKPMIFADGATSWSGYGVTRAYLDCRNVGE